MNYHIRIMDSEDSKSVLEIFHQGILGGNSTFDSDVPTWNKWNEKFHKNCRFIIENEEKVIGWAALQPVSSRICFSGVAEVSIYIDNDFQGKGLGKILLKKLIISSEENGFWMLQSGIFPENKASIAIHQFLGFRQVGYREKIAKMNGIWRDIILLEKRSKIEKF